MASKISNPRDLLVQLLGEILYIERRLTGGVLRELIDAVSDEGLRDGLKHHLEQTRSHVERCESAFRALDAAPTANRSGELESAVSEHGELSAEIVTPALADVFHAQAALRTEHLETALYTAVIGLAEACGLADAVAPLRESLADEQEARELLERELLRLAADACAR